MKQKLKRFMAGFMAMLTLVGTLFTNGTTAFAASPQANIAFWNASVKNSGEVSELKPGYNHGKILYSILDGNSAYCMNFGLRADGGQLMNSYDDASTSMSAQQRKLLSYCLYYGFNSTQKAAPSNSQCDEYIATQAMVWVIVADIFGTGSGDSAARKLCNTAPSPDSSYSYYERLRDNISSSYNATLPSFASRRTSEAPTYELKWNEGSQRFETTLSDSNGVLSDFDFGISGYSVDKNGNSITISSTSVNTTATTGTFTSNAGKVETTSSCVFWLTGKSGYQEFISERPTADPIKAYIKVKTENIGYGELTKTDESSGVKLSGAVYGIYSDSGCTNRVQTMTTDGNGYAKSAALVAGIYYVKEITAPKGYVLSGKVHTLTVRAGQTTGISATDKEQLGAITIYKEGEVLSSWNGSNFIYEKKKLPGATFKVTAGADIYKADGTKVYSAGDVVAESLTTGTDGQVVLSDLHLGTYVVTEIKSIDGYTINTTPQTVAVEYKDQTVTVQYESATIENTRQKADVSVVKKDSDTENPLDGGKYTLYAQMIKTDRESFSMSNNAIKHDVWLEVKDGEYYLTMQFKGMSIYNKFGYLLNLSYFDTGYTYNDYGVPEGKLVPAEVLTTQKDSNGNDVIDQYNNADNLYPELVRIKLVDKASEKYVPLQVFVPIMESIADETGTQPVLMQLDWTTLKTDNGEIVPDKPEEQSPALDYTDSKTGVKVSADKGVFDEGVQVVVTEITEGTDYTNAVKALEDTGKKFKLYNVKFLDKNGNEVTPNGTVSISIPAPAGYDTSKLSVFRINDGSSKTVVKGTFADGFYTVVTKTGGNYALAESGSTITDKQNSELPGKQLAQRCPDAGIGEGQRDRPLQHALRTEVLAEKGVSHTHVIHQKRRQQNDHHQQNSVFEIGQGLQLLCGELFRGDFMQQLLKPSEGAEKAADEASQQNP